MTQEPYITKPTEERFSNFTMFPNCFHGIGACISLHQHPNDHIGVLPGGCIWKVVRIPPGEEPRVDIIDVAPLGVSLIGIPAPWDHAFYYLGPSKLPPLADPVQWCIFADYDKNGKFLPNPKVLG